MESNFGFLCLKTHMVSKYVEIYEKDKNFNNSMYEDILEKTKGYLPIGQTCRRVQYCPLNYVIKGDFKSSQHLDFIINCLSMAYGVKLVNNSFGHVDFTCIRPFHLGYKIDDKNILYMLDHTFNLFYKLKKSKFAFIGNAIYLLFRSQTKNLFAYEKFLFIYLGLDCCVNYYTSEILDVMGTLKMLCCITDINFNNYINVAKMIRSIRNDMIHRGLFLKKPFGFKTDVNRRINYIKNGVEIFMLSLLIRLIFKMLDLNVIGFLEPITLNKTYLNFI